jgi:cobalamin biosynthesis Co2+ chelatase CbiK
MRPAYETIIEAMKKDLNRVDDSQWRQVVDQLLHIATAPERLYLEQAIDKLKYEYAAVQLGKLVLGIRDDDEYEDKTYNRVAHTLGLGRGAARQMPRVLGEFDDNGNLMPNPNPNPKQMELDL